MELPLPPSTRYDQTVRYLLQKTGALLFYWLLRLTPAQVRFERWLPTQLTLPGVRQRLCDGIAELTDLERGGRPFAAIVEVQTEPDATMTGRLLLAGGLLWLTGKPVPLPGDRYELLGIVLNLTGTGTGNATRQCVLGTAEWTLRLTEVNLETLDAGEVLEGMVAGLVPKPLLALIPLRHRGGEAGIIDSWSKVVGAELDPQIQADAALALIFAERVGREDAWQPALKGLKMIESPLIAKLLGQAKTEAKMEGLLRVIQKRYRELPEELATAIRACHEEAQLDHWLDVVGEADTLALFRQQVGL